MLFVLIGLWTIGLLLLVTDPRRPTTRWIASIAFTGGSGGLSAVIHDQLTPYLYEQGWLAEPVVRILSHAETIFSLICYYGLPYTFCMFSLIYHPNADLWRWKRQLAWLLILPAAVSFAFDSAPGDPIPYRYVVCWTTPYIMIGIGMLLHGAIKERNTFLRKLRMLTALAAAPTLFFALFTMYVLPALFGIYEWWRYNAAVIGFTLAVILISSFRYGFMGLQISIRNQKLDYTLRAITSGTSILNHAIKNDVGKIRLFSEKIKSEAEQPDPQQLVNDIEVIMNASQHIYDMIYRIQGQTQEVVLHKEEQKLSLLLNHCLKMLEPGFLNIEIARDFRCEGVIWADRAQVIEVFTNVLTNASEAMPQGGLLTVKLTETKRNLAVEIKDTGTGMDKRQLKRIFDPFYTTKSGKKLNFGLGLSYCYTIIQKHKGTMEVHSKPDHGTSVFINFPKKKGGVGG
ncbi:sensor histidine kinase [Paenibacillus radicis (ex Xue et al. 2023)]|uniref:histidine kinase n=1 Tax=Paenibacillus radicis (ex Xue et al. 2023) TaxID=2972489 RepID=A0ABT1YIQ2_9BACL|nr:HAMP domain-containing sensor histidine kinase [Paenibacillus radicis (ex Xue et al. 2023)]MCR8631845.1 HAMP domain-containing histidine kinase [Paenibacillus radicis (ex Xue et al. 2023)]